MQVYVQKSASTTFPRTSAALSGGELSQPVAPSKPGSCPSVDNGAGPPWRLTPNRLMQHHWSSRPPLLRGRRSSDLLDRLGDRRRSRARGSHWLTPGLRGRRPATGLPPTPVCSCSTRERTRVIHWRDRLLERRR